MSLYQFQSYTEQSHTFTGLVLGYAMAANLNIVPVCYGDSFAIGDEDKSTQSVKVDRDFVMVMKDLIDWVELAVKNRENWEKVHYADIEDGDLIFKVETLDKTKVH